MPKTKMTHTYNKDYWTSDEINCIEGLYEQIDKKEHAFLKPWFLKPTNLENVMGKENVNYIRNIWASSHYRKSISYGILILIYSSLYKNWKDDQFKDQIKKPISNFIGTYADWWEKPIFRKWFSSKHMLEEQFENDLASRIVASLIKRAAIDGIRFSSDHPKKGGGEDIAFCLKVLDYCNNSNKSAKTEFLPSEPKQTKSITNYTKFKCVPSAKVEHPYWQESITGYLRFFRWGYGDVILHKKFPKYRFHQYPNLIEIIFLFLIFNLSFWTLNSIFSLIPFTIPIYEWLFGLITAFIIWELVCEARKLKENERQFTLIPLLKAVLIRQLNDLGRFLHQFPRIWKITCRWDYFCTGESLAYETKTALRKFEEFFVISLIITIIYLVF
ncbi:MAG: hypothetical protein ACOC4M_14870 [Promethearchaeia archaeon]